MLDAAGRNGSNPATADAAPARCASHAHVREAGVTVRAYYEALPHDGWTRTGSRRWKPLDAGLSPVAWPGSAVPSPKIAASWRAARRRGSSFTFARWERSATPTQLRLAARHPPSHFEGW